MALEPWREYNVHSRPQPPHPPEGDELTSRTLGSYFEVLRRHWLAIVAAMFLGIGLGVVAYVLSPRVYLARTTLEVHGLNENFMNFNQVETQASGTYTPTDANIQTQIQILSSESLREKVFERLNRQVLPVAPPETGRVASLRQKILGAANPEREARRAMQMSLQTLRPVSVKSTRVVEITCRSTNAEIGALFLNALTGEYVDQTLEARVRGAQQTNKWLATQLDETKARLEAAENKLQEYIRTSGLTFLAQQDTLAAAKARQLQTDLANIQAERISKQSRYEAVAAASPEMLGDVLDDQTLRDQQNRINELKRELAQLNTTYTPEHYKVKRVQAQVEELEAAAKKDRDNVVKRTTSEYQTALRRERLLIGAYSGQSRQLNVEADKTVQYNFLKRDVDTTLQTYQSLLQQISQSRNAAGIPANYVRIIDPAKPVPIPVRPNAIQLVGLGLIGGLLFGCVYAFVREETDKTIRQPGFNSGLRTLEMGVIPSMSKSGVGARKWLPGLNIGDKDGANRVELITGDDSQSVYADSFRLAIAPLLMRTRESGSPQVIVMASANPSEGKTTVLSNMGIALAEARWRVLLIDLDLRSPQLHNVFNLPNEDGISEYLSEQKPLDKATLEAHIKSTHISGVSVMVGGAKRQNVLGLLNSSRMRNLLTFAATQFDVVFIDTPPLLHFPDARMLGRLADQVLLVVRSGQTERSALNESVRRLGEDGTPVSGIILNDWDVTNTLSKKYRNRYPRYYAQTTGNGRS
jgi:capsular exopolysaccharide synthesis family protein